MSQISSLNSISSSISHYHLIQKLFICIILDSGAWLYLPLLWATNQTFLAVTFAHAFHRESEQLNVKVRLIQNIYIPQLLNCQEFYCLAKTQTTPIVANENTKLFSAGVAAFSKLITFKAPAQQNALKHSSSSVFIESQRLPAKHRLGSNWVKPVDVAKVLH